jgi:hypothetical protein
MRLKAKDFVAARSGRFEEEAIATADLKQSARRAIAGHPISLKIGGV